MSHSTAAATASLTAVTGFTILLGLFFLPAEIQRLRPPRHVSVTHYVPPRADCPGVALCWSIAETGQPGWRHSLRFDGQATIQNDQSLVGPNLIGPQVQPLSLAAGARPGTALIGSWDGSIYSVNLKSPDRAVLIGRQHDGGVAKLAPSADGRYILSQDAFRLYGWDAARRTRLWHHRDVQACCCAVRPDCAVAIVGCVNGDLLEIDLATGQTTARLASLPALPQALSLSSDGSQIAILLANGQLQLADSRTLEVVWSQTADWNCGTCRFVAISPCGRWLVTPSPEKSRKLAVWNIATGAYRESLMGHQGSILGATFGEESLLYSFGADGTVRTWDLTTAAPLPVALLRCESNDA